MPDAIGPPDDAPEATATPAMVDEWNRTAADYPRECCIHDLFEDQVLRRPEATALIDESGETTYAELNRRANRLARYLCDRGLRPGMIVGVFLPRGVELVTAILAVLKAGAAYLPLDAADPSGRLIEILDDAKAAFVLSTGRLRRRLSPVAAPMVSLDDDAAAIATYGEANLPRTAGPESLCYVMYTSGSTGRPKGVMVAHRGVVRLVCGADYIAFDERRTFLQLAPVCFDASTFELWGSLLHGARLVPAPTRAGPRAHCSAHRTPSSLHTLAYRGAFQYADRDLSPDVPRSFAIDGWRRGAFGAPRATGR